MSGESSYGLDAQFERLVAVLSMSRPKFYGSFYRALDTERISDPASKLILEACRAITDDRGMGPSSEVLVFQRLARWREDGKVKQDQITVVLEIASEIDTEVDEQQVLNDLTPALAKRLRYELAQKTIESVGAPSKMNKVREEVARIDALGKVDQSVGQEMGSDDLDEIYEYISKPRLSRGILDMDLWMAGGAWQGTLNCATSPPSGGKSMWLNHLARRSLKNRHNVAFATLELPLPKIKSRMMAALLGVQEEFLGRQEHREEVNRLWETIKPLIGKFVPQYFRPTTTRLQDVINWWKDLEQQKGVEFSHLVLDYADKLMPDTPKYDDKPYDAMREVFENLRHYVEAQKKWADTVTQPQRQDDNDGSRLLGMDDLSDSQHKARILDSGYSIARNPQDKQIRIKLFKFRHAAGEGKVFGPFPSHLDVCRLVAHDDD